MQTKEKIIQVATEVFNQQGFAQVSLRELAQRIGISRGNLAYHFKDKDRLLAAIAQEMWGKIEGERQKSRQFPSFQNLHNEVQLLYKIQQEYAFIFLDPHVLNHPELKETFRQQTQQFLQDNKAAIGFAIKLGNLKPEPFPGLYDQLAFSTWMLSFFWIHQQVVRGKQVGEDGEKLVWSLLLPHFTKKGLASFKDYFGEPYFESLGDFMNLDLSIPIHF